MSDYFDSPEEQEARLQRYGSTMHASDWEEYERIKPLVRSPNYELAAQLLVHGCPNGCECAGPNHLPRELAAQLLARDSRPRVKLTAAERRKLERFIEEASEAIQGATKLLRFGRSANPYTNRRSVDYFSVELGHLQAATAALAEDPLNDGGLINDGARETARAKKAAEYERGIHGELGPE
jgi:hypothetical protein